MSQLHQGCYRESKIRNEAGELYFSQRHSNWGDSKSLSSNDFHTAKKWLRKVRRELWSQQPRASSSLKPVLNLYAEIVPSFHHPEMRGSSRIDYKPVTPGQTLKHSVIAEWKLKDH